MNCLQSPDWGEHRGRYWLDAARYADTHGIHIDNYREIWSYRDWVIKAFNATCRSISSRSSNSPATCCRIARSRQQIGSRLQSLQHHDQRRRRDRRRVPGALHARSHGDDVASVGMGLTAGCAVCHDHKFDPISQKEFYSALGVFQQHDARRDGRQHARTRRRSSRCRKPEDRRAVRAIAETDRRRPRSGSMPAATPPSPNSMRGSPTADSLTDYGRDVPTSDLLFTRRSTRATARRFTASVNGRVPSRKASGDGSTGTPAKDRARRSIVDPGASI